MWSRFANRYSDRSYAIGIDIGATCAKAAVVDETGRLLLLVQPTGWSSVDAARVLREKLLVEGFDPAVFPCVAICDGRVAEVLLIEKARTFFDMLPL